jgi:CVNH domain-containing protein
MRLKQDERRLGMRFLNKLGLVAVAAVGMVVFSSGTANATPVDGPAGSYRATCRDIRQDGNSLRARCKDMDGRWRETQLDDIGRCVGDITNVNGELRCNRESRAVRSGRAPEGSYAGTCRDIRVEGDRLFARCQNSYGQWVEAYLNDLDRCRGDITNVDGRLRCGEERRGPWPQGSYTATCRDIEVRGDSLQARCETADGGWRETGLADFGRCVGEIVNDDGQLYCTRRGGWSAPPGRYTESCRDIYLRGDILRARCRNEDGRWVWSQLDDWDGCRGNIFNDNGQLRCRR